MSGVASNARKIYLYKFLGEFYLIVPVLIPYYRANGLSPASVFTIQAAYTLAVLLLEIPSGYLADVVGRRRTLILAAVIFPAGLVLYALGRSFAAFITAEVVLAVGNSFRSGCDSALLYDSLAEMGRTEDYKKFEGRSFLSGRIGSASASILGGALAAIAIRLPFWTNAVTALFMLPLALSLTEPLRTRPAWKNPLAEILRISRWTFAHPQVRFFILFSALVLSTGLVGLWASFLLYSDLGIPVAWFGVMFAGFQLASALASSRAHAVERVLGPEGASESGPGMRKRPGPEGASESGPGMRKRPGLRRSLLILPAAGLFFVLLGLVRSAAALPLVFAGAALWGFGHPLLMDGINRLIPSETRATVLSVGNMTVCMMFVVLSPLFGRLANALSLRTAYLLLGAFVLVYSGFALLYGRRVKAF